MRILQAKILEWVSMPSSRGSSQPRDQTQVSCIAGGFSTIWVTRWWLNQVTLQTFGCYYLCSCFSIHVGLFLFSLAVIMITSWWYVLTFSCFLDLFLWIILSLYLKWACECTSHLDQFFFSNYFLGDLVSSYNVSSLSKPMSPPLSKSWWSLKQVYLLLYQSNLLFFFVL